MKNKMYIVFLIAPLRCLPIITFTTESKAKKYIQKHKCPYRDYYYDEIEFGG